MSTEIKLRFKRKKKKKGQSHLGANFFNFFFRFAAHLQMSLKTKKHLVSSKQITKEIYYFAVEYLAKEVRYVCTS